MNRGSSSGLDPVILYGALLVQKAMDAKKRGEADAYCGEGESFPLYKDGSHLAAAWDLAGHSPNPAATRECILRFAREHGLMDHLPMSAREHAVHGGQKVQKALDPVTEELFNLAFSHEVTEGDTAQEKVLFDWAVAHGYAAFPFPDGNEPEVVSKAIPIQKAWSLPGGAVVVEGWISTEHVDIQNDLTPPEAFAPVLPDYMALGGPLTTEHQMLPNARVPQRYPVGHVQKAALVRDGQVFLEASHPTDPAEFEHFPRSGTGMWGRAIITDPVAAGHVLRGNVRGFSWTGKATEYERLPGGARKFTKISHLQETTVAAFPVDTKAAIVAVAPQG